MPSLTGRRSFYIFFRPGESTAQTIVCGGLHKIICVSKGYVGSNMVLLHVAGTERTRTMKKTTAEKLDRQYADLTVDGEVRPENMTSEFGDTIRDACDECVTSDFYWLPQVCRENASENAQAKIKTWLITKHGDEAIKSLPAMINTICYREACSEARKSCVVYCDPKTGVVAIDKNTGKVIRVPKNISIDWQGKDEDDDVSSSVAIGEPKSQTPSPVDELERHDMRQLLRKIDVEINKLPKQKADVFRLVAYQGFSALDVARSVLDSKVQDTDSAAVKKILQNKVSCLCHRMRATLISMFGDEAAELGILQKRVHAR